MRQVITFNMIHIAATWMIQQGTDRLSWGDWSDGVILLFLSPPFSIGPITLGSTVAAGLVTNAPFGPAYPPMSDLHEVMVC
jgi:hypothetical protein